MARQSTSNDLPAGASYVQGTEKPNSKVRLANGDIVGRTAARTMARKERGISSKDAEFKAKHQAQAEKLGVSRQEYERIRKSPQFQRQMQQAKEHGQKGANRIGSAFEEKYFKAKGHKRDSQEVRDYLNYINRKGDYAPGDEPEDYGY